MSSFTCITCRVAFVDADVQRGHYKTDWHRYNLKRKVAELPPVTAENFAERVKAQKAQAEEPEDEKNLFCNYCNKKFSNKNAFDNHLNSKKHREAEAKETEKLKKEVEKRNEKNEEKGIEVLSENDKVALKNAKNQALKDTLRSQSTETPNTSGKGSGDKNSAQMEVDDEGDNESVESWGGEALGIEECLFCSHVNESLEDNIKHMTTAHSFFIPDFEYVSDLEGLFTYLGMKVGEGNICLWCNEKGKAFLTTKSAQQHMVDKGHCKMLHQGDAVFEYADFYDYRSSYPDFDSTKEGAGDKMDEGAVGGKDTEEEEVDDDEIEEENYALVLPSGAAIGHRSLQRYYRQKLKPNRVAVPGAKSRVLAHYRGLGWTGTTGAAAEQRAKDVAFVKRQRQRHYTRLGVKANKLQQHFRDPNLF